MDKRTRVGSNPQKESSCPAQARGRALKGQDGSGYLPMCCPFSIPRELSFLPWNVGQCQEGRMSL